MDEEPKAGAPMWIVTFADLMSLLMSFFVMLLSFASMDAMKFKQVAESLEKAFGAQRETKDLDRPLGTSPDLKHFAPGQPTKTTADTVKQDTADDKPMLETFSGERGLFDRIETVADKQLVRALELLEQDLVESLSSGQVELERDGARLVIRIKEKGSFPSGSAKFAPSFGATLARIADALERTPGDVSIEGHTDDIPMSGPRFDSNWELSAARAAAVATAILGRTRIDPARLHVTGYAATRPLIPNDSNESRAKNRRVEVVINLEKEAEDLKQRAKELIEGGREDLLDDLGWD